MNLFYRLKNAQNPFDTKIIIKQPVTAHTIRFIYKFGIFHISVVNKNLAISYGWETAYFFGMMHIVSVAVMLSFQFNNTYLLSVMISTIDYLSKEMVLPHFEVYSLGS